MNGYELVKIQVRGTLRNTLHMVGIGKGQNESPVKRIFVFVQFFDISLCILRSVKSMKKHRRKPTTQKEMLLT